MTIKRVWIEDGCIACNLCEDLVPEVFEVPAGGECQVTPGYSEFLVKPGFDERIQEAADSCPVEVIEIERCAN